MSNDVQANEESVQQAQEILAELATKHDVRELRRQAPGAPWEVSGGFQNDQQEELAKRLASLPDQGLGEATEITLGDDGTVVHFADQTAEGHMPEGQTGEEQTTPKKRGFTEAEEMN